MGPNNYTKAGVNARDESPLGITLSWTNLCSNGTLGHTDQQTDRHTERQTSKPTDTVKNDGGIQRWICIIQYTKTERQKI